MRTLVTAIALSLGLTFSGSALAQDMMSTPMAGAASTLYTVDLESGALTEVGPIGVEAVGLAAWNDGESDWLYISTPDNRLMAFPADDPLAMTTDLEITGLPDGVALLGIDFRPATAELWGVGDDSVLYVIDVETAAATAVGEGFDPAIDGTAAAFDFNPTVDRIRLVTETGQNLRLNPETGGVGTNAETGEPTIDGDIAYAESDDNAMSDAMVVGAGYTNSVADAETTELYVIDVANGVLALQDPPNDGVLNTVGTLDMEMMELSDILGFDITPAGTAYLVISS